MLTYKAVIGEYTFYDSHITKISVSKTLGAQNDFTIGNVTAKTLDITIIPGDLVIPRASMVELFIANRGTINWKPKGVYFIDTRLKGKYTLTLKCYDKVPLMEEPFLQEDLEEEEWPMTMDYAVDIICDRLNIELDPNSNISNTWEVPYTNELTMRDVASFIASAHGGNFVISDADTLKLIIPQYTTPTGQLLNSKYFRELSDYIQYDKVYVHYDDKSYYEFGAGEVEFELRNDFTTEEIAEHIYDVISTYEHRPFEAQRMVFYDEEIPDIGDTFTHEGQEYIFMEGVIYYGNNVTLSMRSPFNAELTHEFPLKSQYKKDFVREVSLDTNYYGIRISRDDGLTITREDGKSKLTMNSEQMTWQTEQDNVLVNQLYFDVMSGQIKYMGNLEISSDHGKTTMSGDEIAIYGKTGPGGTLEKNLYVDSDGVIQAQNLNLVGAITWEPGVIPEPPGYLQSTHIDMSSVASPYVIAGSLQGSNFVHYPPVPISSLFYQGAATKFIGYPYNVSNYFQQSGTVLSGLAVGNKVNIGSGKGGSDIVANATITNFVIWKVDGITLTSTPTDTFIVDKSFYIPEANGRSGVYVTLATATGNEDPFTLYNVPITNHTDLSGYINNIIGGISYDVGSITLHSKNNFSVKISSSGDVTIIGNNSVTIGAPAIILSGQIIGLNSANVYVNNTKIS